MLASRVSGRWDDSLFHYYEMTHGVYATKIEQIFGSSESVKMNGCFYFPDFTMMTSSLGTFQLMSTPNTRNYKSVEILVTLSDVTELTVGWGMPSKKKNLRKIRYQWIILLESGHMIPRLVWTLFVLVFFSMVIIISLTKGLSRLNRLFLSDAKNMARYGLLIIRKFILSTERLWPIQLFLSSLAWENGKSKTLCFKNNLELLVSDDGNLL